ncbi:MAG: AmmeMemoRadiSam system protein A [Gammaproteobacteria bacterium]|nr:AmmeMemoRadiSam system protein A [Gammaproteobacteria bacterium]
MPSTEATYGALERRELLALARASIAHGLAHGEPLRPDPEGYPEILLARRACFVTLHLDGLLRGCIGSLEARRPLVEDVAGNAYAAAFRDPRFPPVTEDEAPRLELEISVLSPPEPMRCGSEAELLAQLRPGVDGLVLADLGRSGTFLPSVWEQLPEPRDFLAHLKRKAGLPADYWSASLTVSRYTTERFG